VLEVEKINMPIKIKYVSPRAVTVEVRIERPAWREFLAY